MKRCFKTMLLSLAAIGVLVITSCENENGNINLNESDTNPQTTELIDECFLVRGDRGELLDLHIIRNEDNQFFISANPSDLKSTDEYIPEYIIIADGIETYENSIILPKTDKYYWLFEATLADIVGEKTAPGGGQTISLECHCMAASGGCRIDLTWISPSIVGAACNSTPDSPCSASGDTSDCVFTTPTITIQEKSEAFEATTKIIIESEMIDYNGVLYE